MGDRDRGEGARVVSRAELEDALAELARDVADPRHGILGPRSLAWRLGGDVAIFAGGGRAALLQLAHPMVAYAIAHHSRTRADVGGRFARTFRSVFAMVFGDLDAALGAARRVHAVHARIHGAFEAAHGAWPAGTPYHASDVDALRWVHATLVDTTLCVRARLDGPLPPAVADGYVREMNRFGRLFGIPHARLPATHAAHAAYVRAMLASDRLVVTPAAREMAAFLFGRGAPGRRAPLGALAEAVTAALLPPHLVAAFGLVASPAVGAAALAAFARAYAHAPRALVRLPAHEAARRRLAGRPAGRWTAWADRRLIGLARHTSGA